MQRVCSQSLTGPARLLPLRHVLLAWMLLALPLSALAQSASDEPEGAQAFIEALSASALEAWTDPALSKAEQVQKFRDLLFEGFEVEIISKLVLGRHYRSASPELVAEYQDVFPRFIIAELTKRIGDYENESIKVTGTAPAGRVDIFVRSTIDLPQSGGKRDADWRIRKVDDEFKIIDVKVDGVSLVVTFREQFSAKINDIGLDGLLVELKQRLEDSIAAG